MIRSIEPHDIEAVTSIYNYYIQNSSVTFEETPIETKEVFERVENIKHSLPWLVYEYDGRISAYAYATPWKARSAYRFSVETSIYVDHKCHQKGIGRKLYAQLIHELDNLGYHSIIGGITLPNDASIRLHENLGFKKIAEFEEVGFKFGKWRNVGYWQLILPEK